METPLTKNIRTGREPPAMAEYQKAGGYQALRKALKQMTPAQRGILHHRLPRGAGVAGRGFPPA